jgi:hypothetical protein
MRLLAVVLSLIPLIASAAAVPPPRHIAVTELPALTNFSPIISADEPLPALEFTVDLDYLAPLGTGNENAAKWFGRADVDSAKLIETPDGKVLRADDPMLREAETAVDQARMRFYPDVWPIAGVDTNIPSAKLVMAVGRSFAGRAKSATNREMAKADYRRTLRLGRLLWQEHVTVYQDLLAIALIKMGAMGLYDVARAEGDAATMTVAAIVQAEATNFREAIRDRLTDRDRWKNEKATDALVDALANMARTAGYRPQRSEAAVFLWAIANTGPKEQRERAKVILDELAAAGDEVTAANVRALTKTKWDASKFRIIGSSGS